MKHVLNRDINLHSSEATTNENQQGKASCNGYADYLIGRDIPFLICSPYLLIGDCSLQEGWLIHISVLKGQMSSLMDSVLPYLVDAESSFAVPETSNVHTMILDGSLGYQEIGKVLTIYPESIGKAISLAGFLIAATSGFSGPDIPTAVHLGTCIYASPCEDQSGRTIAALRSDLKKSWPFTGIADLVIRKPKKWLHRKYYNTSILKKDAKGNVYKSLNFSKWNDIRWCVIKQGKKYQCVDDAGRDIRDRLRWQYKVQAEVAGLVAVPKVIDLIEVNGDTYFIMEYIEGDSYNHQISAIQKGVAWATLALREQTLLTQLSLQVIEVVAGLHQLGYVHRDLSPVNFMVTPENRIVAIDIELSYQLNKHEPDPFFTLGTPGYMSPAQRAGKTPCFEDDIFGIGALLLRTFTGLSPTKFSLEFQDTLLENINYFIKNRRLSSLICACLHADPQLRPSLHAIEHDLQLYYSLILTNCHMEVPSGARPDNNALNLLTAGAIRELLLPPMFRDKTWYSKTKSEAGNMAGELKSYCWYPDFYTGASGVIYTLLAAAQAGHDVSDMRRLVASNYTLIKQHYQAHGNQSNAGLYNGSAGFGVMTAHMVRLGWIEHSNDILNQLIHLLSLPNTVLNLADGIAGQGLAMMKCAALLNLPGLNTSVAGAAKFLISRQQRDGSWAIETRLSDRRPIKITGFLNGVAGITYFLMVYGFRRQDAEAQLAAFQALDWLLSQRKKHDAGINWPVSTSNHTVDPWFENGFTGIAFLFIRAYALFQDERYKTVACETLLTHPEEITSNYVGQAAGLAGLAEVYIEAFTVFGDRQWLQRARHIVDFLRHTCKQSENGGMYWLDGSNEIPEPGFMTGHAGLIHLLLRFQHPDHVTFPLISF